MKKVLRIVSSLNAAAARAEKDGRRSDATLMTQAAKELRTQAIMSSCVDGNMMLLAALEAISSPTSAVERSRFTEVLYQKIKDAEQDARDHDKLAEAV